MTAALGPFILALDGATLPARERIGGKAWSVARMLALGLPVPPAFVITTAACRAYLADGALPPALAQDLDRAVAWLEQASGRVLGGAPPLLVSVRSGAAISMPGMMDTVLNLGIDDAVENALAIEADAADFARDTHRRFLELYASIVLKLTLPELADPTPAALRAAIAELGGRVPATPREQLLAAVSAVFESWNSRRARRYRQLHAIPDTLGTAVTVQAMVFGNLDERSGTGVLHSRNPLTGESVPYGEYLHRAQGEDVVSGKFTPEPLSDLAESLPDVHAELLRAAATLEAEHRDVQDIEFTVQQGRLYLLQARAAKRTPEAAVRCAIEMVGEGLIDEAAALSRIEPDQVRKLFEHPRLLETATASARVLARGVPACQGIGCGVVVTDADEAEARAAAGEAVVLARSSTSPADLHGMIASQAVITEQGGPNAHAALVSRDLRKPCVVGCGSGVIAGMAGRTVTVDGEAGTVYDGRLPTRDAVEADYPLLARITEWAAARCPLTVVPRAAAGADCLDLDAIVGGDDPGRLAALLAGHRAVRGAAVESDAGVAAALAAGVEVIAARHPLPVMLAALSARAR